jgi:5-methylcytosine-specific restriction enzyme A
VRTVAEWVAKNDDKAVPTRVRLRVWERAQGFCEKCGRKIRSGMIWHVDHMHALALGGEHRERNMRVICTECHHIKTGGEAAVRAKSDRIRAKNIGIKKPRSIRGWKKFDGSPVFATRER